MHARIRESQHQIEASYLLNQARISAEAQPKIPLKLQEQSVFQEIQSMQLKGIVIHV